MKSQFSQFVSREIVPGEFYFIAPQTPRHIVQQMFEQLDVKFVAFQLADGRLAVKRHPTKVEPVYLTPSVQRPLVGILPEIPGNEWQFADAVERTALTTTKVMNVDSVLDLFVKPVMGIDHLSIAMETIESMKHVESIDAETTQLGRREFETSFQGRRGQMAQASRSEPVSV